MARYIARAESGLVAKAVLIGKVPPIMVESEKNPGGLPIAVFDGLRKGWGDNRAQLFPSGPFFGYNRPGAKIDEGVSRIGGGRA